MQKLISVFLLFIPFFAIATDYGVVVENSSGKPLYYEGIKRDNFPVSDIDKFSTDNPNSYDHLKIGDAFAPKNKIRAYTYSAAPNDSKPREVSFYVATSKGGPKIHIIFSSSKHGENWANQVNSVANNSEIKIIDATCEGDHPVVPDYLCNTPPNEPIITTAKDKNIKVYIRLGTQQHRKTKKH